MYSFSHNPVIIIPILEMRNCSRDKVVQCHRASTLAEVRSEPRKSEEEVCGDDYIKGLMALESTTWEPKRRAAKMNERSF